MKAVRVLNICDEKVQDCFANLGHVEVCHVKSLLSKVVLTHTELLQGVMCKVSQYY